MSSTKVYFGTDHAGFALKEALIPYVRDELGFAVEDMGAHELVPEDDYPDLIAPVARVVAENPTEAVGIVLGGSGQGEAIVANRFPDVRAVVFNGQYAPKDGREVPSEVRVAREHNDANMLSLGARFLTLEEAKEAVHTFLTTPFPGEPRHSRRIEMIERYGA